MEGDARAQWHTLGSTSPCPLAWGHMGDATSHAALSPAAPAPGQGSVPAAERGPTAALKYGTGKSPTAPCVAFYLNNILSWMTSLYNVV